MTLFLFGSSFVTTQAKSRAGSMGDGASLLYEIVIASGMSETS